MDVARRNWRARRWSSVHVGTFGSTAVHIRDGLEERWPLRALQCLHAVTTPIHEVPPCFARGDVVVRQLVRLKLLAAVLTGKAVADEEVRP